MFFFSVVKCKLRCWTCTVKALMTEKTTTHDRTTETAAASNKANNKSMHSVKYLRPPASLKVTGTAAASTGGDRKTAPHTLGEMLPPPSANSSHSLDNSPTITDFLNSHCQVYSPTHTHTLSLLCTHSVHTHTHTLSLSLAHTQCSHTHTSST